MKTSSTGFGRAPELSNEKREKLTLAAMCLATFVAILDTTVVNLALHAIQTDLRAHVAELQWVVDIYNVAYASFILTGGTLGDLFGRRRTFVTGIVVFNLGSLVCAMAPNPAILITGRAVAGLGAALLLPGALSLLTVTFPEARARARAIALWGGFNGLAMAVGPSAGGLLVDHFGWRSIFLLVLPFGVATLVLTGLGVFESSNPHGRHIDLPGQILAVLALGSLAFSFIQAPSLGWTSPLILASSAICVVSLTSFLAIQRATAGGLLPLEVFANRAFCAALADATLMTFGVYAMLFIFPLYLQTIRHDSTVIAGIELLPLSMTFFLLSPLAGRLLIVTGPRSLIATGMGLTGAGILALAAMTALSGRAIMLTGLFAMGAGLGLITGPIMTVAVSNIPNERSGTSSGLVNVGRMVGATLGVAILGSVFGAHLDRTAQDAAKFVKGMRQALLVGGSAEFVGALIALRFLTGPKRESPPPD